MSDAPERVWVNEQFILNQLWSRHYEIVGDIEYIRKDIADKRVKALESELKLKNTLCKQVALNSERTKCEANMIYDRGKREATKNIKEALESYERTPLQFVNHRDLFYEFLAAMDADVKNAGWNKN